MRRMGWFGCGAVVVSVIAWFGSGGATLGQGIPEPDLVLYGVVRNVQSNANLRLGHGTLTWVFKPPGGGQTLTASTRLTNINDQFSYILRVPCETPVVGFASTTNTIQLTTGGLTYDRSEVSWYSNALTFVQVAQTTAFFGATDRGRLERVDLDVSVPIIFDFNGLPIDWELTYFGRTGIDPLEDHDQDGLTTGEEYEAGTNPNDAASVLRITEIMLSGDGIQLQWASAMDKSYAVQRSSDLSAGFADIQLNVISTPPVNMYRDSGATGPGPYFYRVRLQP